MLHTDSVISAEEPYLSCLEEEDSLPFSQRLAVAFRNHPHLNNVLTHISLGRWDRIESSLAALLAAPTDTVPASPLERNLLDLLWAERGVTGRIMKPVFLDVCHTSLPPSLAERVIKGIAALSLLVG